MKKQLTLKHYILCSWLIAGGIAFAASMTLFLGLGSYSYSQAVKGAKTELTEKANKAARRLSAELLIAPRGAPESVRLQLQKDLNVNQIEILPIGLSPHFNQAGIQVEVPVPQLEKQYMLFAATTSIGILDRFNFVLLIGCFALIGIITAAGLWLQIKYLNRHIIRPIEALVQTSTGEKNVCDHWPLEIQEISEKLNNSFKERDQVIYSQVARGVIHDIRTLLQSLQVATDLVSEKQSDDRLKNLHTVSKAKLPNLLGIINTALDGSREITVNPKPSDLIKTLQNSIETNKSLAVAKNIKIHFENSPKSAIVVHDSIQLERVFTNILKNAVEAVETSPKTEKSVRVGFDQSTNGMAKIIIEDNGPGLSTKPDSVFRLLKSTKPHGSGLGLLVSRKIVEAHGGNLTASNSLELKGAKFEIQIPMEAQL
jgi:signal transduction histidine kinase